MSKVSNPDKVAAKKEMAEVKEFAKGTSAEDFRSGAWFPRLVHFALATYREKATAEYFQEKYPGLPPDAVVDRRISLAKWYAAVGGATTGAAYTGAIAATIGTKGGASPITVPAALTALGADLCMVSYLQLRLAYDVSVLYGRPLNYEDPEDLQDLLILAFGIKAGEAFTEGLQRLAPEGVRVLIRKTVTGANLQWLRALPVVGRHLLQRNIIKTAIPVVGIGLGFGVNYYFTGKIGKRAKQVFRTRVAIYDSVRDIDLSTGVDSKLLLEITWLAMVSDKAVTREEAWMLRDLVQRIRSNGDPSYLDDFARRVNYDENELMQKASQVERSHRELLFDVACIAAVADGKAAPAEVAFLERLAAQCGIDFDKSRLATLHRSFS